MLLGGVTALVIPIDAKAISNKDIKDNITEVDLDENCDYHTLIGDCTLKIDHDKTIDTVINLSDYNLTINGTGTLRINGFIACDPDASGSLTVDGGNLEVILSIQAATPAISARNISINGGSVKAVRNPDGSVPTPAIYAYNHIDIASSLEIIKPSGGKVNRDLSSRQAK